MSAQAALTIQEDLPQGWAWAHLGEISSPVTQAIPSALFDNRFTYLDISSIDNQSNKLTDAKQLTTPEAPSRARQLVSTGDTLFSTVRTYLKNIAYVDERFDGQIASTGFCVLRPNDGIEGRYIFHYVLTREFIDRISALQRGVSYPAVRDGDVRAQPIPVAPTNEQRRIVDKIDELFSQIEAAEQALERAQKLLERYRQSVLNAAVTGELTRDWREQQKGELESGETLLKRILQARREAWEKAELAKMHARGESSTDDRWKQRYKEPEPPDTVGLPDLPEGWAWASLDQLIVKIETGKNFRCEERPPLDGEFGLVKISAVTWGVFDEQASKTVTDPTLYDENLRIRKGDFLFSRANTIELVGASVIVNSIINNIMISDKVIRFVFSADLVRIWIDSALKSGFGRRQIEGSASGNQESMRNISQRNIRRIILPLPPAAELEAIIDTSSLLFSLGTALRKDAQSTVEAASVLRQSVLNAAFSGRLVPQDPADEPASVLLERVRETRAATPEDAGRRRAGGRGRTSKKGRPAMDKTRKDIPPTHLRDIIRASNCRMAAEALWKASELDIDDFYKQLREEVAAGHLREERDGHASRIVCH
jgi:type I restriction enzyme, S subunit